MNAPPQGAIAPKSPRVWTAIVAYAVAFVAILVVDSVLLVLALALSAVRGGGHLTDFLDPAASEAAVKRLVLTPGGIALFAAANATTLGAIGLLGTRLDRIPVLVNAGRPRAPPWKSAAAIVGFLGLSLGGSSVLELLRLRGPALEQFAQALSGASPAGVVMALVGLALFPGVGEELFFRAYFQPALTRRWGVWPAVALTSLGFGVIHMDLVQGAFACAAGVYLGWIRARLGDVRVTIAGHVLNNALFVLWSTHPLVPEGPTSDWAIALGGTAVLCVCLALVGRRAPSA